VCVVRPVCICIVAMVVASSGMVLRGGPVTNIIFGSIIVAVAGVMIFQVHWAVTHLGRRSQLIRQGAVQAEQHYINVLREITHIVEARDRYTGGHSERVGRLAEQIAHQLGLPAKRCEQLNLAGQLHDIGLLAVPDRVLRKQEGFGVGDYRTVQKHSEISYELLKPLESLADILPAIRYHHERLNGTGYPLGLAGDDIPLEARILAVADAYEAMTHDRPQRSAMTPLRAMEELRRCTPSGYDGRCVEALAQIAHLPQLREIMSLVESKPAPAQA
jgi:HD-GYP domain-containing protein (c-di-GMP phosphodiesterase class II)